MNFSRQRFLSVTAIALAAVFAIAGCSHDSGNAQSGASAATSSSQDDMVAFSHAQAGAPQSDQRLFASPEAAAAALKEAVDAKDRRALVAIFGDEGKALIFSGDRVQENNDLAAASERMHEYLHVDQTSPKMAILYEGKENWPFPIPLVKAQQGWFFDVVAGRDELLDRRIGEDELNAIAVCRAFVVAQKEYAGRDHMGEYAQHFMSTSGKKDGLYWDAGPGQEVSPMGPLVAEARLEGYPATRPANHKPQPYKGYIFHILKAQGPAAPGGPMSYIVDGKMTRGFALVASPSAYGRSGIMSFIVSVDGKVYQKNLGADTKLIAADMTLYNPEQGWVLVKD